MSLIRWRFSVSSILYIIARLLAISSLSHSNTIFYSLSISFQDRLLFPVYLIHQLFAISCLSHFMTVFYFLSVSFHDCLLFPVYLIPRLFSFSCLSYSMTVCNLLSYLIPWLFAVFCLSHFVAISVLQSTIPRPFFLLFNSYWDNHLVSQVHLIQRSFAIFCLPYSTTISCPPHSATFCDFLSISFWDRLPLPACTNQRPLAISCLLHSEHFFVPFPVCLILRLFHFFGLSF